MAIPAGKHTDWFWPFSLIPRSWNAIASDVPPVRIWGNEYDADNDIPEPGEFIVAGYKTHKVPVYFALTTESGWHVRLGLLRYDHVDHYYTGPTFTIKRLG